MLVVPRKTTYTPAGAWVGYPDILSPHDENIDISVVFTWDIPYAKKLHEAWTDWGCTVRMGGPAFDDPGNTFTPGQYVKNGVVFTSRGCVRDCPWCYVPKREGKIRELPIVAGHIVQDNNVLACSRNHQVKVFEMLKTQRAIAFKGGLDPRILTDWFVEQVRGLRIHELWLAADHHSYEMYSEKAIKKLSRAGFSRNKIRCYVMIGFEETIDEAEERLKRIYYAGALPFAQVYDGIDDKDKAWRRFARAWQRPAATNSMMKYSAYEQNKGPAVNRA
jgi:hypothetical protein